MNDIVFLVVIANRKLKEELLKEICENEGKLFNVIYGHGSVKKHDFLQALGLVAEQNKVVITCLIKKTKSLHVINLLNEKYKFKEPNTGIAFTIPVENIKY